MPTVAKPKGYFYLKYFRIKGYKSINDVEVNFNSSFNILIGKNASGKTNFLDSLYQSMGVRKNISFKYAQLEYALSNEDDTIIIEYERETNTPLELFPENKIAYREKIFLEGKLAYDSYANKKFIVYKNKNIPAIGSVRNILLRMGLRFLTPLYVRFVLPAQLDVIDTPGLVKITLEDDDVGFWSEVNSFNFVNSILWEIESSYDWDIDKTKKINKTSFQKKLILNANIKENLKKYSPIQDIRFQENINIYKEDKSIVIENLKLEYKINNKWVPWSQLSDGTKRLFYLISEVTDQKSGVVLLDEPELGIHPHQFNLTMEFLKQESENKQIIITTHSPLALNHLNENELGKLWIVSYNQKEGTDIKNLSKTQHTKAKKYMKEVGFLSDYWMISDLE